MLGRTVISFFFKVLECDFFLKMKELSTYVPWDCSYRDFIQGASRETDFFKWMFILKTSVSCGALCRIILVLLSLQAIVSSMEQHLV